MKLSRRSTFRAAIGAAVALVAGQIGGAEAKETAPARAMITEKLPVDIIGGRAWYPSRADADEARMQAILDRIRETPWYQEFIGAQVRARLAERGPIPSMGPPLPKSLLRPNIDYPAVPEGVLVTLNNCDHAPGGTGIGVKGLTHQCGVGCRAAHGMATLDLMKPPTAFSAEQRQWLRDFTAKLWASGAMDRVNPF